MRPRSGQSADATWIARSFYNTPQSQLKAPKNSKTLVDIAMEPNTGLWSLLRDPGSNPERLFQGRCRVLRAIRSDQHEASRFAIDEDFKDFAIAGYFGMVDRDEFLRHHHL